MSSSPSSLPGTAGPTRWAYLFSETAFIRAVRRSARGTPVRTGTVARNFSRPHAAAHHHILSSVSFNMYSYSFAGSHPNKHLKMYVLFTVVKYLSDCALQGEVVGRGKSGPMYSCAAVLRQKLLLHFPDKKHSRFYL